MADYVTGVKTSEGVKKIDYNALANKPGIVTAEEDGLMSAGDKVKFDEICEDVKELQDITSQAGTDIEDIKQDMSAVQQAVENAQSTADEALELANTIHGIVTSGDGSAYTAEVGGISALDVGVSFMMIPHTTSTSTSPTLNVNGLGPVNIRRQVSTGTSSTAVGASEGWLGENKPICATYDGEYWVADIVKTDISDIDGVVPVEKGGTGSTNLYDAVINLGVPTLHQGIKLPDDADLNNYINPGTYYHDEPSNLSHCPVNQCFKLIVSYGCAYRASQTIIQDIIIEATGERLRRTCVTTSGEWTPWIQTNVTKEYVDNSIPKTGAWEAYLSKGTISNQSCTYTLINDTMCILSFFIKGTGVSSSDNGSSYYLRISGMPFYPKKGVNWYAGGGHVQGLSVNNNAVFTGFVYDLADNAIMARDNVSGYLYVSNGGKEFYLSGTIAYPIQVEEIIPPIT